jgi:hypothetical protein
MLDTQQTVNRGPALAHRAGLAEVPGAYLPDLLADLVDSGRLNPRHPSVEVAAAAVPGHKGSHTTWDWSSSAAQLGL